MKKLRDFHPTQKGYTHFIFSRNFYKKKTKPPEIITTGSKRSQSPKAILAKKLSEKKCLKKKPDYGMIGEK
ncbi:MAG: hypothetical protein D3905_08260 [Candidatus Electrothrix sp. AS4_5]|nr:hypothetical protein [Candidatus Electrothrix gigas]MCI5189779.1 hypothetical protein [Candidatus Electrothrix gigas]